MNDNAWLTFLGRVFQVIGIPLVIGGTFWGLGMISDMRTTVTEMKTQLNLMSKDPYSGADAKRDLALRDTMIKFNTDRYTDLVLRVQALETGSAMRGAPGRR